MQRFTSANTSINSTKLPAIYSRLPKLTEMDGKAIIDIGGGKFDNAISYCGNLGASLEIYDKFNRTAEHNERVCGRTYDMAICSNVLNVIDSQEDRLDVLEKCREMSPNGLTYITVYEGDRSGIGRQTGSDQWQENRKLKDYLPEVLMIFQEATIKNSTIVAR